MDLLRCARQNQVVAENRLLSSPALLYNAFHIRLAHNVELKLPSPELDQSELKMDVRCSKVTVQK